jgi:hypothetical protein
MTPRNSRVLVSTLAVVLGVASLGCGVLDQAKGLVDTAQILSQFADRLGKAATLTYTAEYRVKDGANVTLVQQPPSAAFVGKSGSFIFTKEYMYVCGTEKGETTCQRTPNNAPDVGAADAGVVAGVTGAGFVTPEIALGLIAAAAFVPGAKVETSERTIAAEKSLCANATNLDAAATPGDEDAPKDFSVCVTEAGILASFSGTTAGGEKAEIELVKYAPTADPKALAPPSEAKIVDVTTLEPPK